MAGDGDLVCPRCEGPVAGVPLACEPCALSFASTLEVGPSFENANAHAKLLLSLGLKLPAPNLAALERIIAETSIKAGSGQGHALLARHHAALSEAGVPVRFVLSPRPPRGASATSSSGPDASKLRWLVIGAAAILVVGGFFLMGARQEAVRESAVRSAPVDVPARAAPTESIDTAAVTRSIVSVKVETSEGTSSGTGFAIAPGTFLTNRHVIEDALNPKLRPTITFSDGKTALVDVETASDRTDLALLVCSDAACQAAPGLPMRSPTDMKVGETVFAFGSPIGLELTLTRGILSHGSRKALGTVYLQTDLAVNPGNSGGPLLDAAGRVVGIVTAKVGRAEGIAFALPIDYYVDVVQDPKLRSRFLSEYGVSAFRPEFVKLKDSAHDLADIKPRSQPEPGPRAAPPRPERATAGEPSVDEVGSATPRIILAQLRNESRAGMVLTLRFEIDVEIGSELGKHVRLELESIDGSRIALGSMSPSLRRVGDERVHYRFDVEVPQPRDARIPAHKPMRLHVNDEYTSLPFAVTRR